MILSNIWLPLNAVIAIYRNRPSNTARGMYARGYGRRKTDNPIKICETMLVIRVSLTLTILKTKFKVKVSKC